MEPDLTGDEVIEYIAIPFKTMPDDMKSVYEYWSGLCAGRFAPTWQEFDMMKIPPDLLPCTIVKDVESPDLSFRYRFYGSHFVRLWDKEMTGKTIDELESVKLSKLLRETLAEFIKSKVPTFSLLHMKSDYKAERLQLQLRLPISNDGENVTNIATIVGHLADKNKYAQLLEKE